VSNERLELAGLATHVISPRAGGPENATLTVVLLHGFGAPGTDLVDLGRYLDIPNTRFVFPEAPLELGGMYGEARAWWRLDLAKLEHDLRTGNASDRSKELPEGLPAVREQVGRFIDELAAKFKTTTERIVLGGFSQGSMVSIDVALHHATRLAGLVLLSSTIIAESAWAPLMTKAAGLPVFQSHGRGDALLPFSVAEQLRDKLKTAGALVEWHPFNGGHEIPPMVLSELATFLRSR